MDMAVGMKGEISQFLLKNPRLADTAGKILHRALEYGQFARSPDWFNDDMNFAAAVQQALSTKSSIIASCMALPLDRADVAFASLAHLATAPHESRKLLLAGWLHSEPAATTIDFRDMSLSADEAAAVAACLAKLPKLVAINVLRNDSMGFDGAQAFSSALGVGQLKSVCGVAPGQSVLEVPRRDLSETDALLYAAELEHSQWADSLGNEQNAGRGAAKLMRKGRVDGNKWYPLIWAARDGNNSLLDAMIKRGADIDQQEEDKHDNGYTPLMMAANKGHAKTVELLLERGASTTLTDNHKRTAHALAEARGFVAIAELISYCGEQAAKNQSSFFDVLARAATVKNAVSAFKKTGGSVSFKADANAVPKAAQKLQSVARGRTDRKMVESVDQEVAAAPKTAVENLAKRAMMTAKLTQKLKATIVPTGKLAKAAAAEAEKRRAAATAAAQTLADVARLAAEAASAVDADDDGATDVFAAVTKAFEAAQTVVAEAAEASGVPPPLVSKRSVTHSPLPSHPAALEVGTPRAATQGALLAMMPTPIVEEAPLVRSLPVAAPA